MNKMLLLFIFLLFQSCSDNNEQLKENARLNGRETSEQDVQAQNQNLEQRSIKLENDLKLRYRYYLGFSNQYDATTIDEIYKLSIRTDYIYSGDRNRLPEEIISDIEKLALKVDFIVLDKVTNIPIFSCSQDDVKVDLKSGLFLISNSDCPVVVNLKINKFSLNDVINEGIEPKNYFELINEKNEFKVVEINASIQKLINQETITETLKIRE